MENSWNVNNWLQNSINLTWFGNCVISSKLYVPIVTSSTENLITIKQLESGFKKMFFIEKNINLN